jgi:hypothetical protein
LIKSKFLDKFLLLAQMILESEIFSVSLLNPKHSFQHVFNAEVKFNKSKIPLYIVLSVIKLGSNDSFQKY